MDAIVIPIICMSVALIAITVIVQHYTNLVREQDEEIEKLRDNLMKLGDIHNNLADVVRDHHISLQQAGIRIIKSNPQKTNNHD